METIIALLVAGVILLFLELFLPGLVAGIVGILSLIAGVTLAYFTQGAAVGNTLLLIVGTFLLVGGVFWLKYFPNSRMARPFVSHRQIGNINAVKPDLLHQTGFALTLLRPSGTATINGKRVDVITEGSLIERGTEIQVVAIEGMRVVVRPLNIQNT